MPDDEPKWHRRKDARPSEIVDAALEVFAEKLTTDLAGGGNRVEPLIPAKRRCLRNSDASGHTLAASPSRRNLAGSNQRAYRSRIHWIVNTVAKDVSGRIDRLFYHAPKMGGESHAEAMD